MTNMDGVVPFDIALKEAQDRPIVVDNYADFREWRWQCLAKWNGYFTRNGLTGETSEGVPTYMIFKSDKNEDHHHDLLGIWSSGSGWVKRPPSKETPAYE